MSNYTQGNGFPKQKSLLEDMVSAAGTGTFIFIVFLAFEAFFKGIKNIIVWIVTSLWKLFGGRAKSDTTVKAEKKEVACLPATTDTRIPAGTKLGVCFVYETLQKQEADQKS